MSFHRFVHVAGWAAVILLTIVGFAAFNAGGDSPTAASPLLVEPAAAATVTAETQAPATTDFELDTGWLDSVAFREMVNKHFASSDVNQAVRLAWCLSRFDVDAIDPSTGAVGLFQIAPTDWDIAAAEMGLPADADPFDGATNVAVAAHIVYAGAGWPYWSCP